MKPLSDHMFETTLSYRLGDAENDPSREVTEAIRALLKDPRAKKVLKKWDPLMSERVKRVLDPVLGELMIRIGEAERTKKLEVRQALKRWVSGSKELKAALDRMPYFRDRYRRVTKKIVAKPLDPGFERLQKAAAQAFAKRLKKRAEWVGGVFEQEFFYLAIDGEPEKVRDATLARTLRDVIDEPVDGIDADTVDEVRKLAALTAIGLALRKVKAPLVTLSDDLESPRRQVKVPKIAGAKAILPALCKTDASRALFERLFTQAKGPLIDAL